MASDFAIVADSTRIAAAIQGIVKSNGVFYGMSFGCAVLIRVSLIMSAAAASDSRKRGVAAGY